MTLNAKNSLSVAAVICRCVAYLQREREWPRVTERPGIQRGFLYTMPEVVRVCFLLPDSLRMSKIKY